MAKMVGLSRSIKFEWLNKTAELVISGLDEKEIKDELNDYLSFEIKSPTNLRKTREILMNIWIRTQNDYPQMYNKAINAFQSERSDKRALHWCMMLVAYPVFADVCGLIGKLTNIQDTFTTAWLKEKLFETWGERTTLLHSSDKILQTLRYIGAIENQKTGVYCIKQYSVTDVNSIEIILMAILALDEKAYYEITDLSSIPQLFPFKFEVTHEWLHNSDNFNLNNFGGKIVLTQD